MSILNWTFEPSRVAVITDTLGTNVPDNTPLAYLTKVWPLPHAGMMICGIGWAPPAIRFWQALYWECGDAIDIAETVREGSKVMRKTASECAAKFGYLESSVIAFGWDRGQGRMLGYRFDSGMDFAPVEIPYGRSLHPPLQDAPQDWYEIAMAQQAEARRSDPACRVNIGGDVFLHEMTAIEGVGHPRLEITHLGGLAHYQEDLELMRERQAA